MAPLFSGNTLGNYQIKFDPQLAKDMYETARAFWHDFVLPKVEPPIDQTESYGRYLARRFSLNTGKIITSPSPQLIEAAGNLKTAQDAVKDAEETAQLRKNQLMAVLADADAAVTPFGKVQWIRPAPRKTVDWKGIATELAIPTGMIEDYTSESPVTAYVRGYWRR